MTLIGAEFYVELHGISADADVLGESITVHRGPVRYRIDLPTEPGSFKFMTATLAATGDAVDPRDYSPTTAVIVPGGSLLDIRLVRIVANTESALSVKNFDTDSQKDQATYTDVLDSMWKRALQLAAELCDQLRLEVGQYWIEPRGTYPRVVNMVGLVDIDEGRDFGQLIGGWGKLRVLAPETVLDASSLPRVKAKLSQGSPHADQQLLAEATYLAKSEPDVGSDRATLLAAIAVELRTKRALRDVASSEQAEMLDLLLENPRDWSLSAHGLFLKALPVLSGVPPTAKHKAVAKRVQSLFTARNKIAHTGESVNAGDASENVQTAWDAFALMEALVVTDSAGSSSDTAPGALRD